MTGAISYHPYGNAAYPYQLNDPAYRKNATRDATATLKAWLNEHRKNPYPTKGEKIMLAIITKMTLTQVSTWFANARRRLKKENKMTWAPKNKGGEERKEEGGAEELLGCLNGDTFGRSTKISHAPRQASLDTTTTEAGTVESTHHKERPTRCSKDPVCHN